MKERFYIGGMFIIAGLLFLLSNFNIICMNQLWPLFILTPGVFFFIFYFDDRKNTGLLMPGAILTSYGLLFLYCEFLGWENMDYLWPVFIMAPGAGFYLMYYFGTKEKALLIPGSILIFIGLACVGFSDMSTFFWPVLLIGIGIFLLVLKK